MNKSIVLLLCLFLMFGCATNDSGQYKRDVSLATVLEPTLNKDGSVLPDIWWYDQSGSKTSLRSIARDKKGVISFWATWCIPCKVNISSMRELQRNAKGEKVLFLGISTLEQTEPAYRLDFVSRFVAERELGFQILLDDDEGSLWKAFGLKKGAVPTNIFFSSSGKIVKSRSGAMSEEALANELNDIDNETTSNASGF